jgi:hypothetical protein
MLLALIYTLGLIGIVASGGGGGGGSDDSDAEAKIEISGSILETGGAVSPNNPIGLQGAANRPVSLYQIDDDGNIIGDVLDSGTSDSAGNYVLLLPDNVPYSSDLIVEAQLDNNQSARAIVIDESTDITPITEYITQKLIDDPLLDLSALPVSEVTDLIVFVESLPLSPQPDLTTMLVEIASFSDLAVEAEINDLATANPQIRLTGLLSVPAPAVPRSAGFAQRPVPNNIVDLFRIDEDGNPVGPAIATTTTNDEGVFSLLLPVDQSLSGDLMLRAIVGTDIVRALATSELLNLDPTSEYVFQQIIQTPDLEPGGLAVNSISGIVDYVDSLNIPETTDLPSTLADIDAAAGPEVANQINNIIIDANVTAPVVDAAGPFALAENSVNTTAVGTVTATDADPVGSVTGFSITAGNTGSAFAIDNGGAITVANSAVLDRETNPSFTLTVTATDGTNVSAGENFVINLTDVNDNAPVVDPLQSLAVVENAINTTIVGTVTATDVDTAGTITDFTITGGNIGNAFAIDAAGVITVTNTAALDRETNPGFTLTVTATDGTNVSTAENVAINVTDANDNAPVVDVVGPFSLPEDAANATPVGTVTATDVDTGSSITGFAIIAGNTGTAFAINAGGVITVADTSAIDYESATSFTLTVTATDSVNTSAGQAVTINIGDVNDTAPVVDAVGPFSLPENTANAITVGTVTATDGDAGSTITGFAITAGNTGTAFAIDAGGEITVANTSAIDYEIAPSFTLTVTATDGVNTSAGQAVTIDITDVNDTAPVVGAAGPFALAENSPDTTPVGTVTASDVDTVGTITSFTIVAGNPNNAFAIDAAGAITVATSAELDRETNASFTLTITATDGTNTSAGEDVVINLSDLNDTAPVITPGQNFTVASSAANTTAVGTVIATDADITGSLTGFSITAGNTGNTFLIAATGQITVLDNTNLLAGSPYTLTITATDGTNTSVAETVGITVTTISTGAVWDNFNWDDGSTWQ